MNVLVTGAAGFLGRTVVDAFLANGHEVRALVRPGRDTAGLWRRAVDVVHADLASAQAEKLDFAFDGVDALVHLAAVVSGDEATQFAATVVGTERTFESMARSSCRRAVLASSFTVYDWSSIGSELTESTPLTTDLEGRGAYTRAKVWQERVARRISDENDLALTILRPGIIWGPGGGYLDGVALRIRNVYVVFGRGVTLPFTFVGNCAACFVAVTEHSGTAGQVFNVVDPERPATAGLVRAGVRERGECATVLAVPYAVGSLAARTAGAANRLLFGGQGRLPSALHPARFQARFRPVRHTAAKLERTIGWSPPYDLRAALDATFGGAGGGG